jgi:pyruvate carboxylase
MFVKIVLQYFSKQCYITPHDPIEGFHADDGETLSARQTVVVALSLDKASVDTSAPSLLWYGSDHSPEWTIFTL